MLILFKYTLFLISLIFLTACWPLEDENSSSNSTLLPAVNNSLSSESPVGIWMLEIAAVKFESYYFYAGLKENSNDHTSNYLSYKFLIINENPEFEDSYIINDCYNFLSDMPQVSALWQLNDSTLSLPTINDEKSDTGLFIISSSAQGELKLINNRALSGTQNHSVDTSELSVLDNGDPLVSLTDFYWDGIASSWIPKFAKNDLSIKGVKISDEINFTHAAELNVQLDLSNTDDDFTSDSAQLKCMSSSTNTKVTLLNNIEDKIPQTLKSSSNMFNIHFLDGNSFQVETLSEEDSISNIITLALEEANSLKTTKYSTSCLEAERCETLRIFEQSSLPESKGQLSTTVKYSTADSNRKYIDLSISVK